MTARFDFVTSLNKLVGKHKKPFLLSNRDLIPEWAKGSDFLNEFLPYVTIIGDSREQKDWIQLACKTYGINFGLAKKDKKLGTENLKEGDYTFRVDVGERVFDFTGKVAYERKGSLSELYNNCTGYNKTTKKSDRERIENEFERFLDKKYDKVVLMLEIGENLLDLVNGEFRIPLGAGRWETKSVGNTIFTTLMSWRQPNNKNFDIIQSESHLNLFWLMLIDMFYYFRGEIKKEMKQYEVSGIEKSIQDG